MYPVRNSGAGSLALCAAALFAAATLHANGTRLPSQDIDAIARGYSFAATADNPSAIYYNPAGIAQLREGALQAGVYFLRPTTEFRGAAGPKVAAESETFRLPFLFASQPFTIGSRAAAIGAGLYAPFGLSSKWSDAPTGFRTLATDNRLVFRRYALSGAVALTPKLLLGASLQYNRANVDLTRGMGFTPTDRINFTGRGHTESFNAGLLYQPTPQHSFGVQFQSRAEVKFGGTMTYDPPGLSEPASGRWPFPSNYTISYSYRPTQAWNFEVGYDRTDWSSLQTLVFDRAASGPLPMVFGWKDSTYYEFGGSHYWQNGWQVSAGGCWSGNSVPDATYNPSVPDYDRWLWNAGVGFRKGGFRIMTLVQYSPPRDRVVSGSLRSPAGESGDGTYTSSLWGGGIQAVVTW